MNFEHPELLHSPETRWESLYFIGCDSKRVQGRHILDGLRNAYHLVVAQVNDLEVGHMQKLSVVRHTEVDSACPWQEKDLKKA